MRLIDLIKQTENDEVSFEVSNDSYGDWDNIDVLWNYSPFLKPFENYEVNCLTAIKKDVFRFTLSKPRGDE